MKSRSSWKRGIPLLIVALTLTSVLACGGGGGTGTSSSVDAGGTGGTGGAGGTGSNPPAALVSVTVAPNHTRISAGGHQRFTAAGNYSDGTTQDITAQVTWSSSNTAVAIIDASGYATGITDGICAITATFTAASANFSMAAGLTIGPVVMTARGPIRIYGDDEFTFENGVVSGSGTQTEPYIIEGWIIDASQSDIAAWPYIHSGIAVGFTEKNFVIRDCRVTNDPSHYGSGIELSNIANGAVQNCRISGSDIGSGISLGGSTNVLINGNTIENCADGITNGSSSSDGVTISSNTISGCSGTGIEFHYLTNSSATNNTVTNNSSGIYASSLWFGGCTISGNQVLGNTWNGIELDDDSEFISITGNNTSSNGGNGIAIYGSSNNVSNNMSNGNGGSGIVLDFTGLTSNTANSNRMENNAANNNSGNGIYVGTGCINNRIIDSIFLSNNRIGWVNFYYDININASPNELLGNTYGTSHP
jgi:parallel beta-helix repeat protein